MSIERSILDELVNGILTAVGSCVDAIVLYGSAARGTAGTDSDIDIAVMIKRPLSAEEDDRLADVVVDMDLKYNKVFSVIDIASDELRRWKDAVPFYRNVDNEGVILWKAA